MTRKTVIFIVEGNTDKTALENIFRKIYKNKNINVEVTQEILPVMLLLKMKIWKMLFFIGKELHG